MLLDLPFGSEVSWFINRALPIFILYVNGFTLEVHQIGEPFRVPLPFFSFSFYSPPTLANQIFFPPLCNLVFCFLFSPDFPSYSVPHFFLFHFLLSPPHLFAGELVPKPASDFPDYAGRLPGKVFICVFMFFFEGFWFGFFFLGRPVFFPFLLLAKGIFRAGRPCELSLLPLVPAPRLLHNPPLLGHRPPFFSLRDY